MTTTLLVIDIQNDYFPGGAFPLWNTELVLDATIAAIARARAREHNILLVQHLAASAKSAFFRPHTSGAAIHPRLLEAAAGAAIVTKAYADSFHQTDLATRLAANGTQHLHIAGMMTQNCVTHTALSKAAEHYQVRVLADCTTTVSDTLHQLALQALSTRVLVGPDALGR